MEKVLYWPGRGKDPRILSHFLSEIKNGSMFETIFPFEYDNGEKPFYRGSSWFLWLENNCFDWWIGISLGASLAYMMASICEGHLKRNRLTLINPFQCRHKLSEEKNFTLDDQWDFSPIFMELNIENIDMIISVHDEKIPIYHGIELLNHINCPHKKLIFVDDYHRVGNLLAQKELADILTDNFTGEHCGSFEYCYIYQ